jgi:hypothetical protein
MKEGLAKSICAIHPERPAIARCPSCRRFFCGECVTEHGGRLVCAACLAAAAGERRASRGLLARLHPAPLLQFLAALALVWLSFYLVARFLGDIPDTFHDGTIWE